MLRGSGTPGGGPGPRWVEIAAGAWRLRAEMPDGIVSLAVEADDEAAAAEHAELARRWLEPGAPDRAREEAVAQLAAARAVVAGAGLGYLGVLTGVAEGRPRMIVLGIGSTALPAQAGAAEAGAAEAGAATPGSPQTGPPQTSPSQTGPAGIGPGRLLASLLRQRYPEPWALVEEFETPHGHAVGVRRCDQFARPAKLSRPAETPRPAQLTAAAELTGTQAPPAGSHDPSPGTQSRAIDTGISQALVIFPEAGLVGAVTGYCFDVSDIDLATLFTARIAHGLVPVPAPGQ